MWFGRRLVNLRLGESLAGRQFVFPSIYFLSIFFRGFSRIVYSYYTLLYILIRTNGHKAGASKVIPTIAIECLIFFQLVFIYELIQIIHPCSPYFYEAKAKISSYFIPFYYAPWYSLFFHKILNSIECPNIALVFLQHDRQSLELSLIATALWLNTSQMHGPSSSAHYFDWALLFPRTIFFAIRPDLRSRTCRPISAESPGMRWHCWLCQLTLCNLYYYREHKAWMVLTPILDITEQIPTLKNR